MSPFSGIYGDKVEVWATYVTKGNFIPWASDLEWVCIYLEMGVLVSK